MTRWCVDDHHDTPCPEPCEACREGCTGETVTEEEARTLYPEWTEQERDDTLRNQAAREAAQA